MPTFSSLPPLFDSIRIRPRRSTFLRSRCCGCFKEDKEEERVKLLLVVFFEEFTRRAALAVIVIVIVIINNRGYQIKMPWRELMWKFARSEKRRKSDENESA